MTRANLRKFCLALPGATEDVKWGYDLCFSVGKKMFCVTPHKGAFSASLRVPVKEFLPMTKRRGIVPAPYVAKYHWVLVESGRALTLKEWKERVRMSYEIVLGGLPKKTQRAISGEV